MKNPWQDSPLPIIVQAPMEDVTDTVFRQMLAEYGKPDIFFTEFTNVDGIFSAGRERVIHCLAFNPEIERPIIARIWGHNPENYYEGARYVKELGFDGVDINMGCPQDDIVKKGLCGALINNHEHAEKVIRATTDGAAGMPVSVKTRIGVKEIVTEEWVSFLLQFDIAALTIHGRTVAEKSRVPCHWDEIGKAVRIRNEMGVKTRLIGNGDVVNRAEALRKINEYGVDGVMIARGMMDDVQALAVEPQEMTPDDRRRALVMHLELFQKTYPDISNQHAVRKYVSMYIRGFNGAKELRSKLVECDTILEMLKLL